MTFLNPQALGALGAVAAPIAIHFLHKARVEVTRWGAMRFLLESLKKHERRLRLEDLLLLMLRCLLLALLALAFARPIINPAGRTAANVNSPAAVVLLVDQSASMNQSNGVETRFEEAKNAARAFLDQLGPGSLAGLSLVSDRVNQVVGRPSPDLALVRRALEIAEPSNRSCDLLQAVRTALENLRSISGVPNKTIALFTDNQAAGWRQLDRIKELLGGSPDVQFRLVPIGDHGEENLAITALRADESVPPAVGQLFACTVEVGNFGSQPATNVQVSLAMDDSPPADQGVIEQIPAGETRAIRLSLRLAQPGFQILSASIPGDRMPVDNQRALAINVLEQMPVTIVEATSFSSKMERDSFFLVNALAPVPPAQRSRYFLKVTTAQPSWLAESDLIGQKIIALCNVGELGAPGSEKLRNWVGDGGALFIFPGPDVSPDSYNNNPALRTLLPAAFGPLQEPDKHGGFAAWQSAGYSHAVTALWNDPHNGNLGSVRTGKYFPLIVPVPAEGKDVSRTIVSYSDNSPAIVERAFGKGRVVVFSSTSTTQWNNLPIHPGFVPLMSRLVGFATRHKDSESLALSPGATFRMSVGAELAGRELEVIGPGGKRYPAGHVELVNRQATIRYSDTERAGGYRLFLQGGSSSSDGASRSQARQQPIAAFTVDMPAEESDVRVIAPEGLSGIQASTNKLVGGGPNEPAGGVRREFWTALLAAAAGIACLEMVLAHQFTLAK